MVTSSCISFPPPQDQACEDVDYQVESPSSSEGEENEQEAQRKQQAVYEKEKVGLGLIYSGRITPTCVGAYRSLRIFHTQ